MSLAAFVFPEGVNVKNLSAIPARNAVSGYCSVGLLVGGSVGTGEINY